VASGDQRRRAARRGDDDGAGPHGVAAEDDVQAGGRRYTGADAFVRALSVVPFLIVAVLGLIGVVAWVLIMVFGLGSGQPIWRAVQGFSTTDLIRELFLAVLIGAASLAVAAGGSWATAHGFREDSGRVFWTVTQGVWGLALIGMVYVWRAPPGWLDGSGFASTDRWFAFGVVAFAVILAGVRRRGAPPSV